MEHTTEDPKRHWPPILATVSELEMLEFERQERLGLLLVEQQQAPVPPQAREKP